ncbi:MAG: DNA-3-methyladenine glycosylase I [Rhizobacter sp.]|nr:DNA-3-methyladenine glycosylase I [Bacteriovorax sp.]
MRAEITKKGSGKVKRCFWAEGKEDYYVKYHDKEWGRPVRNDKVHFEFMVLEGAQAGLSWSTILSRREAFRKAYSDFDVNKVAKYTPKKIESMMKDESIIRNRLKITSSVSNAKLFIEIQKEFGSFNKYVWSFVGGKPIINKRRSKKDYVATSKESDGLSADLKKRGFKFVGSTIMYSHMQACGLVNDHEVGCFCYKKLI